MKNLLMAIVLFLGISSFASAQTWESVEFNNWTDGSGRSDQSSPILAAGASDTTVMLSFEDYLGSAVADTLLEMAFYATDTAQAAAYVDYYAGTKLIATTPLDSLVFKFNTDKTNATAIFNVWNARKVLGATHFQGRVTNSATYNKNSTTNRLGAAIITKD